MTIRVSVVGYDLLGKRIVDAVACQEDMELARLVKTVAQMARVERLYANVITRAGHATQQAGGSVDSLEPLPADGPMTGQLAQVLGHVVGRIHVSRVRAPYTHSNLHTVKLDLDVAVERVRVISCSSTGAARFLFTLDQAFGLERAFVALARRAADPAKPGKTPYNALKPTMLGIEKEMVCYRRGLSR